MSQPTLRVKGSCSSPNAILGPTVIQALFAILAPALLLTACASTTSAPPTSTPTASPSPTPPPPSPTPTPPDDPFSDLPTEARVARGAGQPRTAGYWAL